MWLGPPSVLKSVFFSAQVVIATGLIVWQAPKLEGSVFVLAFLVGLNILSGLMPINIYGRTNITVGFVFTLTVMIIFGVPGAVILAPIAALAGRIGRGRRDIRIITTGARMVLPRGQRGRPSP